MASQTYQVIHTINEIDSDKLDSITKQCRTVLESLKVGQTFEARSFVKNQMPYFCKTRISQNIANIGYRYLREGKKLGILYEKPSDAKPISFDEFLKLDSITYWLEQLSSTRYKNLKLHRKLYGTQETYAYQVWAFNNWLYSKTFECHLTMQIDNDTFKQSIQKITLKGAEHLLELYKTPNVVPSDFIKIIKKYLLDPTHSTKKARYITVMYCAIMSYFEKNDYPLFFKFDPKKKFDSGDDQTVPTFGLEEFMKLLTVGRPTLTEKAVFLCKFHRGLDASTLVDRFNFQAWRQLVEYFGTEKYHNWDLIKCPVPIILSRIKTDFRHTGFLEYDAIKSIQDYLDYRYSKTRKEMSEEQPLFINKFGGPINTGWVSQKFFKLATNAGLQKLVNCDSNTYAFGSHELRDLLKSTLLACGTRYDVADHVIGHKPKDSYEKQASLYSENLRLEFCKVSRKINIFSNMSNYMKGDDRTQLLHEEIKQLKETLIQTKESSTNQLQNEIEDYQRTKENVLKILQHLKL
jgi:hypothetical protein